MKVIKDGKCVPVRKVVCGKKTQSGDRGCGATMEVDNKDIEVFYYHLSSFRRMYYRGVVCPQCGIVNVVQNYTSITEVEERKAKFDGYMARVVPTRHRELRRSVR